jgi:hypothetical protein
MWNYTDAVASIVARDDLRRQRLLSLNDPLLQPLIDAPDELESNRAMERLISERGNAVIARVVARYASGALSNEADDIASTVRLRLIARLRLVPKSEEHAIENVVDYIAILAYNTTHDFFRVRFPQRARLKKRLRYLIERESQFSSWSTPQGQACGLSEWPHSAEVLPAGVATIDAVTRVMTNRDAPGRAVEALLRRIARPLLLDDLARLFAEIWNVSDVPSDDRREVAETVPGPAALLESKEYFAALWSEVNALRPMQRRALLLNLRSRDGANALAFFVLLNVATIDAVAAAVDLDVEKLAALWNDLPLDDNAIAAMLGVTRQQVINLRAAARKRLGRRMETIGWRSQ